MENINIGNAPFDPGADNLRDAFKKVNVNFQILEQLGASGFRGNIVLTTPAPDDKGYYIPSESGVYANFGNISVSLEEGFTVISFDGENFDKQVVPMDAESIKTLENLSLTYKYIGVHSSLFNQLIKNIFIESKDAVTAVRYVGINDNPDRKILIQLLNQNQQPATFILRSEDIRPTRNKTLELIFKEDDVTFREKTRVWIEFNDVEFPASGFLAGEPDFKLYSSAFQNKESQNFLLKEEAVQNVFHFKGINLIENLYIIDSEKRLNVDNVDLVAIFINQYAGERKFLIFYQYEGLNFIHYTTNAISSGQKNVRLETKEVALDGIEVYIDFKEFQNYPAEEFTINYLGQRIALTDKVFQNFEIETNAKIQKLESFNPVNNSVAVSPADGNNGVQLALNSITGNSASNRFTINVANGIYAIKKKEDFIGNPGYPAMICPKDYVDIVGQNKESTILYCDLSESPAEPIDNYQTIYNWANEATIENITFICKNLRYTLHQDNPQEANGTRYYKNVDFVFLGNGGYYRALGTGTYSGSRTFVEGGKSQSQVFCCFSVHNNINFAKPSLWSFKNHSFVVTNETVAMRIYNCGSNQDCEIKLENCSLDGAFIVSYEEYWLGGSGINDHFNHANFRVRGSGNSPFYFDNSTKGKTLAVSSISKTKNSKVRFDTESSAFSVLVKNNSNQYFASLGNPNRKIKEGYVIQDGALGISAFAFGGLSILENYPAHNQLSTDSLGKRLGNCAVNNLSLGINIDGSNYTVVFNQDYTNFTNAQVIALINGVIGAAGVASEYNIGADYYAELTDVVDSVCNISTSVFIPKGTLVTKKGNKVDVCQSTDVLYGLAIDDIPPYELDGDGVEIGSGRVIRNCYVSLTGGNISSVLNSGSGNNYKIVNGLFVADDLGQYRLLSNQFILIK